MVTFLTDFSHILFRKSINFNDCRGQSYDNASNMSGKYGGMQALLRRENPLAFYIPCTAHSLNLVGVSAVDCCVDAVSFFGFVQALYTFFCFNSPLDSTIRLFVTRAGKEPYGKVFVRDQMVCSCRCCCSTVCRMRGDKIGLAGYQCR